MFNSYVRRMRREMRERGLTYHDDTLPTRRQNAVLCAVAISVVVAAIVLQVVVGIPGAAAGGAPNGPAGTAVSRVAPTTGPIDGH